MATGPGYRVEHRRRREQKTDYQKRLKLLKSGKPRAVVRISNNHAQVQIITYSPEGDQTIASARSSDLEEHGWEGHTGNLSAAYLTGLLAGRRAVDGGVEEAVTDIGLQNSQHGTRIFAAVKGVVDAGVDLPVGEEVFPDENRIQGEHIAAYRDGDTVENFEQAKSSIEG